MTLVFVTGANTNTSNYINLGEALALTEQRDNQGDYLPFSMEWVTYDKRKNTGGKKRHEENLVRCGLAHNMLDNATIGVKFKGSAMHPFPIHIDLILKVNDKQVSL